MKKKETWREKKVNYKKIKLLSTIISICLIVAVMGIGVLASTQQYSAQVSNSISMRFANLNGTVSVKAYADRVENNGSTGMTDRPELSSTNLFTNDEGALYTSISSGATVANENLQFTGADFFRVGTDTEVGLTSDTTKAVIGYIFKYEPDENLAEDVVYNKVTITETSGSALNSGLNGSSIETKYYITTDNVDTATAEQYITAIVPNEGASYEVEGTKTFYVLAFCTYENKSGMSIKVEGTWSFGLNIEASAESTLTTTSLENNENNLLNTVSVEQDNPTIARLQNVTSVNKTVTEIKPTDTGYATYRAMVYVTKVGEGGSQPQEPTSSLPTAKANLEAYSWAEVKQLADALANGTLTKAELSSTYHISIGSTKSATINSESHSFRLVDINHDVDTNGNTLGMTFEQVDLMNSEYVMKSSMTSTDSWSNSDLKTTINNFTIESSLDAVITAANKECCKSITDTDKVNVASKLWIMSETEIAGTYTITLEGTQYEYYTGKSDSDRIKTKSGSNNNYWLRSPNYIDGDLSLFVCVGRFFIYDNFGNITEGVADTSIGVALCFCI